MDRNGFRRLAAYERSVHLADEIRQSVSGWSPFDRWTAGLQMLRAADSVGANIAEAYGRWGYADRRRLLFVARGSLCELEHWLMRAEQRHLPVPPAALERAEEIGRMLNGIARAWRS
jgi:four helix bundle protein